MRLFPPIFPPFFDFLFFPLLFVFSFFHFPPSAVAFPQLDADGRDSLPKANWVLMAEGNRTALTSDAFRQAKLTDQNTKAKVERIERMMNNSLHQNEQILRKGVDALQKLAKDGQKMPNGDKNAAKAAIVVPMLSVICPFILQFLVTGENIK